MLINAPPTLLNTIMHSKHWSHLMAKSMNELAHKSPLIIRMVLHLDSLWNRGTRELENGLLDSTQSYYHIDYKWTNQNWGWNHLTSSHCHRSHHEHLRKAEEVNIKANFLFFMSLSTAEAHVFGVKFIRLYGNVGFICDSGLFLLRRKRFMEWCLASDGWSGLHFHSFKKE